MNFDSDRLSCLKLNPLSSDNYKGLSLSNNLDPDSNFFSDVFNCDFYTENTFNDMLQDHFCNCENLSLIHFNIRSIGRNFENLTTLLHSINNTFSIIGVSETWLRDSSHSVDMNGYNCVHNYRSDRPGGGVGLYLSSDLQYKFRNDLGFPEQSCVESLFIEIVNSKGENIIVGIVYRPPNQIVGDFISNLNTLLGKISKENKTCYLMGDFNLNLLNNHCHESTGEFLDIMYSHMFLPLITLPTRITSHTATLIDNIFANHSDNYSLSGLLLSDISDHLPIFCITREQFSVTDEDAYFRQNLSEINWYDLEGFCDPENAYDIFLNKYHEIYNNCFPCKRAKSKKCTMSKPWLSRGLIKSIKRKSKLYKRYLNVPNYVNEVSYKKYKNKLNHSLRIAKRNYYDKQLDYFKTNTKNTWKILNEVINKKKRVSKLSSTFIFDNQEIPCPFTIANHFCDYFTNIGPNLAKNIPESVGSHCSYLSHNYPNSIYFNAATTQEVSEIVNSLRPGTAAGYDKIPMFAVKDSIDLISEPLTHIINLSISTGVVPDKMKIARVIPLFKSGDYRHFQNYRPISVLPIFSKLLERIVYNRIINYVDKFDIISDHQYGFRKNHSTSQALLQLYNKISAAIDRKEFTVGIFLDLSKAFDTVNHDILFDKLEHYGIRGVALDWMKNYFHNRLQFVQYNDTLSTFKSIRCGVPQGSILGPLLFLLYINDLCDVTNVLEFILFADDTNLFYSHKNQSSLANVINREIVI